MPGLDAVVSILTTRSSHPRSAAPDVLAAAVRPYLAGTLALTSDVDAALEGALALAGPDDLVCITGSLFVAAAARARFGLGEPD